MFKKKILKKTRSKPNNMKLLSALIFTICLSSAIAGHGKFESRFSSFKSRFGKHYSSKAEEIKRFFYYSCLMRYFSIFLISMFVNKDLKSFKKK